MIRTLGGRRVSVAELRERGVIRDDEQTVTPLCRECDRPADPRNYGHYCSRACLKAADL